MQRHLALQWSLPFADAMEPLPGRVYMDEDVAEGVSDLLVPKSPPTTRWFGPRLSGVSAVTVAPSSRDEVTHAFHPQLAAVSAPAAVGPLCHVEEETEEAGNVDWSGASSAVRRLAVLGTPAHARLAPPPPAPQPCPTRCWTSCCACWTASRQSGQTGGRWWRCVHAGSLLCQLAALADFAHTPRRAPSAAPGAGSAATSWRRCTGRLAPARGTGRRRRGSWCRCVPCRCQSLCASLEKQPSHNVRTARPSRLSLLSWGRRDL